MGTRRRGSSPSAVDGRRRTPERQRPERACDVRRRSRSRDRVVRRAEDVAKSLTRARFEDSLRTWGDAACDAWGYPPVTDAWLAIALERLPTGLGSSLSDGVASGE